MGRQFDVELDEWLLREQEEGRLVLQEAGDSLMVTFRGKGLRIRRPVLNRRSDGAGRFRYAFTVEGKRVWVYANRVHWVLSNKRMVPEGFNIDHIDGNRLNGRPENLRLHNNRESDRQGSERGLQNNSEKLTRFWEFVGRYGRQPEMVEEQSWVETGF